MLSEQVSRSKATFLSWHQGIHTACCLRWKSGVLYQHLFSCLFKLLRQTSFSFTHPFFKAEWTAPSRNDTFLENINLSVPYLVLGKSKKTQRSRSITWEPTTISNLQINTFTSSPYSRSLLHGGKNRRGKSKISTQTLFLMYPGRGGWSVLGQPLTQLSSNRVSSVGIWKWGWEKKWLNLLNHKVRSYELFTANHPPYVSPLGTNRGSLSQRGKQNQTSRQAQSDKICVRKQESQGHLLTIHFWVLEKSLR